MNSITQIPQQFIDPQHVLEILNTAKLRAEDHDWQFTGTIAPHDAWLLFQTRQAVIVDVRTLEERKFVGFVQQTIHIPWATGTGLNRNPHFITELEAKFAKDQIILLLCRSGKRSAAAASVAFNAGFTAIYNIDQGFEGDLNEKNQRGAFNGWRFHDLPWQQE